jgi:hypothetical protein
MGSDVAWDIDPMIALPFDRQIGTPVSMHYDSMTRYIYWIDANTNDIRRVIDIDSRATVG